MVSEQEVNREGEGTARAREPENAEEVIKWMVKRLRENENVGEAELKKRTVEQFGSGKLPDHFHWIVVGMKEGLRRGREAGQQRERRRKRDIRVQTERVGGCGVRVQTDLTGIDIGKMEKRAYESIRASRKKSKVGSELGSEKLEVTIVVEKLESEVEVIIDREENMPDLLEVEEGIEFGEDREQGELPILSKEGEGQDGEGKLGVKGAEVEEESELGEMAEIELGWEEAWEGDLEMAGGAFGALCEAVAMVELEELSEKGEIEDDLLTGWELPEVGIPDGCSSPF